MINKYKAGDNYHKERKSFTQTKMFFDLNNLTNISCDSLPNKIQKFKNNKGHEVINRTIQNYACKFKSGNLKTKISCNYILNDNDNTNKLSKQITEKYSEALKKMIEFSNKYFYADVDSPTNCNLVSRIIEFISSDDEINDEQLFYVCSDGTTMTKSEICNAEVIEFESFLLGVWHYTIDKQRLQISLDPEKLPNILIKKEIKLEHSLHLTYQPTDNPNPSSSKKKVIHIPSHRPKCPYPTESFELSVCDQQMDFYPFESDEVFDIYSVLKSGNIVLSRSIFFHLLIGSICTSHSKSILHTEEIIFCALSELTTGNNCQKQPRYNYPCHPYNLFKVLKSKYPDNGFDDTNKINSFLKCFENDYFNLLSQMIRISKKYFNSSAKNECLVAGIIEFIKHDKTIKDSQEFYIFSDETAVTKSQICEIDEIEFEPFLLGIWYYAIKQLDSKDNSDEETFNKIFKIQYKYNGKLCERYRSGNFVGEKSNIIVYLSYLQ